MPPSLQCQSLSILHNAVSARTTTSASRAAIGIAALTVASRTQSFSTSSVRSRVVVPPESPLYITVPTPPQSSEEKLPPVRGHLPRPRQIFKQRGGYRKLDPDFVDRTAPLSHSQLLGRKPKSEVQAQKWELAEARRQSLAEGIKGLWERKSTHDRERFQQSRMRFLRNRRDLRRPDRLDDVFTRATILGATAKVTEVAPDPSRFELAEKAQEAHATKLAQKSEARQDALAQLYMASSDFIVDEAELEARVNDIFDNPKFVMTTMDKNESQWGYGAPISISNLRRMMEDSNLGDSRDSKQATLTTTRQKQLAEELTGGKME